jgi:hypothetical protein
VEKKNPAEGGASKPGLGHAGAGGRRYVTAVGRGGLDSGAGTQPKTLVVLPRKRALSLGEVVQKASFGAPEQESGVMVEDSGVSGNTSQQGEASG